MLHAQCFLFCESMCELYDLIDQLFSTPVNYSSSSYDLTDELVAA